MSELSVLGSDTQGLKKTKSALFSSLLPSISVENYVRRLLKYIEADFSTVLIALILLKRAANKYKMLLSKNTAHRSILVALVLALKVHEDTIFSNKHFAKVGGVRPAELKTFELDFLAQINFDTFISTEEFEAYLKSLDN